MENLLSERDSSFAGGEGGSPRGGHVGLVKYGSTGSISSIGSNNHFDSQLHGSRPATYTPSSLYRYVNKKGCESGLKITNIDI